MTDVVFYEAFAEEAVLLKKYLSDGIKAMIVPQTIQESGQADAPSGLISVRTQSVIPDTWAPALSGILSRSAGHDHLSGYLSRVSAKIPCGYLPDYCSRSVAEQAILMILFLLRRTKAQLQNFSAFCRDGLTGQECLGKKLLVVGVGRIGSQVVQMAQGLGIAVRGVDLEEKVSSLEYVLLADGLAWADIVVCALPLTGRTRGLLDEKTLRGCRRGMILINIARGEITPLSGLVKLLDEGLMGGLGLDVFENEDRVADAMRNPRRRDSIDLSLVRDLEARPDVILTPHNAFNTFEALERKARQSVASAMTFLKEGAFPNPIPLTEGQLP